MRSREELGRALAETNPQRGGREATATEAADYDRAKLYLEVLVDIRELLKEDMEGSWAEFEVEDEVPDPV